MENENENKKDDDFYLIAKAFCDLGLPMHIEYKDGGWHNGYIREMKVDFFLLDEFKDGLIPVFFSTIEKITKYVPKGDKK